MKVGKRKLTIPPSGYGEREQERYPAERDVDIRRRVLNIRVQVEDIEVGDGAVAGEGDTIAAHCRHA
jgi:FKBP-type peptidyl-prolyl cis-trans isomerase